jgi:hypothetical protein
MFHLLLSYYFPKNLIYVIAVHIRILSARHKMQSASLSKMMVHLYQSTKHHISNDWNVHTLDDFMYLPKFFFYKNNLHKSITSSTYCVSSESTLFK